MFSYQLHPHTNPILKLPIKPIILFNPAIAAIIGKALYSTELISLTTTHNPPLYAPTTENPVNTALN